MDAVYIHIPFCSSICTYCDFSHTLHIDSFVDDYLNALKREIENHYDGEQITTLYIGGGTPSCLSKNERRKLFKILTIFKRTTDCECTIEVNPLDITEELLDDYVDFGINRISIGVESFDEENLRVLGRTLDYEDLKQSIEEIKRRGITNINLDLMYALPNEKLSTLKKDIKLMLKLEPTHISTYSLIIAPHTKLSVDGVLPISEELDRKMYDTICSILKKNKFKHYEVSNFCLEGYESKHNLKYWNNLEYYGFGLGASGYRLGFRYENTRNIHEYIKDTFRDSENLLTHKDIMDNEIMVGLRKLEGIDVFKFFDKYKKNIQDIYPIEDLLAKGLLAYNKGYLYIPEDKIYIMDEILLKIL